MPFNIAQNETTTTQPTYPIDYGTDPAGGTIDIGFMVAFVIVAIVVILVLLFIFLRLRKGDQITGADIRPTMSDMSEGGLDFGKYFAFNGALIMITMFIDMAALGIMLENPIMSTLVIVSASLGAYAFKTYLRDSARSDLTTRSIEGIYRDKTGKKSTYVWKNVRILDEYILTDADFETIQKTNEKITKEMLDKVHVYPVIINSYWEAMVITRHPKDEAFEWAVGYDYDMHGEFEIEVASPELREVATIHKIGNDPYDNYYKVNEYVPIFLSVWDDAHSKDKVKGIDHIDTNQNHLLAALLKVIGVERRYTAGEMNTDRAALLDAMSGNEDFDDMVNSRARSKANSLVDDMDRLSAFDIAQELLRWDYILMGILVIVVAYAFWQGGWNAAVEHLTGAGSIVMMSPLLKKLNGRGPKPDVANTIWHINHLENLRKEGNPFVIAELETVRKEVAIHVAET